MAWRLPSGNVGLRREKGTGIQTIVGGTEDAPFVAPFLSTSAGTFRLDGGHFRFTNTTGAVVNTTSLFSQPQGLIEITGGAKVEAGSGARIHDGGRIVVTGAGTRLSLLPGTGQVDSQFLVGPFGGGTLTVTDRASADATFFLLGNTAQATPKSEIVVSQGGVLKARNIIFDGAESRLTVNGGSVFSHFAFVRSPSTFKGGIFLSDRDADSPALTLGKGFDGIDFGNEFSFDGRIADAASGPGSIRKVGLVMLDSLGAIIAGRAEPELAVASKRLAKTGKSRKAGSPLLRAFADGTAGTMLEIDEGNQYARGHPGIHVVPAIMAAAQNRRIDGRSAITALALGYEIGARIGIASKLRVTMHPHGTWGTVGAAVGIAKLNRASVGDYASVINVASSLGLTTSRRTMLEGATVRNTYAGFSNMMGMMAWDLVKAGFTGEADGVGSVYGGIAADDWKPEEMIRDLGQRWEIARNYFKRHAACRYNHGALDALSGIMARAGGRIDPADIESIGVETYVWAAQLDQSAPTDDACRQVLDAVLDRDGHRQWLGQPRSFPRRGPSESRDHGTGGQGNRQRRPCIDRHAAGAAPRARQAEAEGRSPVRGTRTDQQGRYRRSLLKCRCGGQVPRGRRAAYRRYPGRVRRFCRACS